MSLVLGIQTDYQKEVLRKYGTTAVCVDSTHGTTQYTGYLLLTVMTVGNDGKGHAVAWFIISGESRNILEICFKALHERYMAFLLVFLAKFSIHTGIIHRLKPSFGNP